MNPEIKQLWIESLRSGEYAQGEGALRRTRNGEDEFCCLGVLCDLAEKAGVVTRFEDGPSLMGDGSSVYTYSTGDKNTVGRNRSTTMLPMSVVEWAQIEAYDSDYPDDPTPNINGKLKQIVVSDKGYTYDTLWELNDSAGFTFDQIADVIEAQF